MTGYEDLLARAQANPQDADFHALRMACARSVHYAPYIQDGEAIQALREALHDQDMEAALEAVGRLLTLNYLDIEAHMAADYVHIQLENHAQSTYHRAFARGLIDAILATGSGRDFDSAIIVISVAEEYLVLRILGLIPNGQRLVQHDGHWFDVLSVTQPQAAEAMEIYFNIDLPRGWQTDRLE